MDGVNRVVLIGRIDREPKIDDTEAGPLWTSMLLAMEEHLVEGELKHIGVHHSIVCVGQYAAGLIDTVRKGNLIYLEGKLVYRVVSDSENNKYRLADVLIQYMNVLRQPVFDKKSVQQPRLVDIKAQAGDVEGVFPLFRDVGNGVDVTDEDDPF